MIREEPVLVQQFKFSTNKTTSRLLLDHRATRVTILIMSQPVAAAMSDMAKCSLVHSTSMVVHLCGPIHIMIN